MTEFTTAGEAGTGLAEAPSHLEPAAAAPVGTMFTKHQVTAATEMLQRLGHRSVPESGSVAVPADTCADGETQSAAGMAQPEWLPDAQVQVERTCSR